MGQLYQRGGDDGLGSTDLTLALRHIQTGLRLLERADAVMEADREILDAVRESLTAATGLIERAQHRAGQLRVVAGARRKTRGRFGGLAGES